MLCPMPVPSSFILFDLSFFPPVLFPSFLQAAWFIDFKPEGPWKSSKCDSYGNPPKCSNHYHMQEQTPGYPHGDGTMASTSTWWWW